MSEGKRHKVWLHIGMPKTGTTSIQRFMYSNRRKLARFGYFYPDFDDFQHIALVRKLAREAGSKVPFPGKGEVGEHARFLDLVAKQPLPLHTSIVSSENFFQRPACAPGHPIRPGMDPFALLDKTIDKTAEYFAGCDVTVLTWLRRQDNWLMSMYNQTIKSSMFTENFDTFAQNNIGADLLRVVQAWIRVFGRQQVICQSYDALAKSKVDMVERFLQTVCPDVPREALSAETNTSSNPSLSNEALWLKKRINHLLKEAGVTVDTANKKAIRGLIADVTRTSPEPGRPLLGKAERKVLMERYLAGNHRLITELDYGELQPLIEIGDLDGEPGTASAAQPQDYASLCVDRMIGRFVVESASNP